VGWLAAWRFGILFDQLGLSEEILRTQVEYAEGVSKCFCAYGSVTFAILSISVLPLFCIGTWLYGQQKAILSVRSFRDSIS